MLNVKCKMFNVNCGCRYGQMLQPRSSLPWVQPGEVSLHCPVITSSTTTVSSK